MKITEWGDLHCHITMKPFHSSLKEEQRRTMGYYFGTNGCCSLLSWATKKLLPATEKDSQANLQRCRDGNLGLAFNALYPIEVEWFDIAQPIPLFINENNAFSCMANFDASVMNEWFISIIHEKNSKRLPYFDRLTEEYMYLCSTEAQSPECPFVIIKSFTEYQQIKQIATDKRLTAIVNTIEGAHSLFNLPSYNYIKSVSVDEVDIPSSLDFVGLFEQANLHVTKIKAWKYPPLFITLAHHFWNFLVGHAQSIGSCVLDQKQGLDTGFSKLGLDVTRLLLSSHNGPRILIDIKHLSPQARTEYYALLDAEFPNTPILASHAAVTGFASAADSCPSIASQVFQTGEINLYDSDLLRIVASNGLIGIMMEEGRLLNKDLMKSIKKHHDRIHNEEEADQYLRQKMAEIVLAQALYVVEKTSAAAWNCICIGSDFDGMINSLDLFTDVTTIPTLFDLMVQLLDNNTPILQGIETFSAHGQSQDCLYTSAQVAALKHGNSGDVLIEKLRITNLERFMSITM